MSRAEQKNSDTLATLTKLSTMINNLTKPETKKTTKTAETAPIVVPNDDDDNIASSSSNQSNNIPPTSISHWRQLPHDVTAAYKMIDDGSSLIKSTSTKYTLVGKINRDDTLTMMSDFCKASEFITTGLIVLHDPIVGCSPSTRHHARRATSSLIQSLHDLVSYFSSSVERDDPIAAQKTGVVWDMCDLVAKIPKGNRNAARRDFFGWMREADESFVEFKEILDAGEEGDGTDDGDDDDVGWDDFCDGGNDHYSVSERGIAEACVALIKCSRGTMNVALKAMERVGEVAESKNDNNNGNDEEEQQQRRKKQVLLQWMMELTNKATTVGEGVTDLGVLIYPPLDLLGDNITENELMKQMTFQKDAIVTVHDFILNGVVTDDGGGGSMVEMEHEVMELSGKIRNAAHMRFKEGVVAFESARAASCVT